MEQQFKYTENNIQADKVISFAFKKLNANALPLVVWSIIYLLVLVVITIALYASNWDSIINQTDPFFIYKSPLYYIMLVIGWLFSCGMIKMGYDALDDKLSFSSMFHVPMMTVVKWFLLYIMLTYIMLIGFMLLIVPGIYLMVRLYPAMFLLVDKDCGSLDAIKKAWRITKGRFWNIFLASLLISLVACAGYLACGLGLVYTAPLALISYAFVVRQLEKGNNI